MAFYVVVDTITDVITEKITSFKTTKIIIIIVIMMEMVSVQLLSNSRRSGRRERIANPPERRRQQLTRGDKTLRNISKLLFDQVLFTSSHLLTVTSTNMIRNGAGTSSAHASRQEYDESDGYSFVSFWNDIRDTFTRRRRTFWTDKESTRTWHFPTTNADPWPSLWPSIPISTNRTRHHT